jgi:hypothetical protein
MTDAGASARAAAARIFDSARDALAGAPRERLGELVTPRFFAAARGPRIVPRAQAWRLGVLLLGEDEVYAVGEVVTARDPGRRGFTAQSSRERAERGFAALRGGFAEGEAVHLGWQVIDLDAIGGATASTPLAVVDGVPSVRWSPRGGFVALEGYVAERIELLRHPPAGAS